MEFELPGCVLAKNRKQVEEIVEGQVARSIAGEDFEDPIAEWIFLSFNTENDYENEQRTSFVFNCSAYGEGEGYRTWDLAGRILYCSHAKIMKTEDHG